MTYAQAFAIALIFTSLDSAVSGESPSSMSWADSIRLERTLISAGRFGDARSLADALIESALASGFPPHQVRRALAEATICRAIAESRLIQGSLSEWDWYVAINLDPAVAAEWRSTVPEAKNFPPIESVFEVPAYVRKVGSADPSVVPPVVEHQSEPRFPRRARMLKLEKSVAIEAIIETDGRLRRPRLITRDADPSLAFAALEAPREWRFIPASASGSPVAVLYALEINFKLSPAA